MSKYVRIERGIYRYVDRETHTTYHEGPIIDGKRTYRSLGFNFVPQRSLKHAREEYYRRRAGVAAGKNPYEEKEPECKPQKATVGGVIQTYIDANYPDKYLKPRIGGTLKGEAANCQTLLEYWNGQVWDSLTPKSWDDYHAWRVASVRKGCSGDSSADKERITLCNAFKLALRKEINTSNPVRNFPRHHPLSAVHQCREYQPQNSDELHEIARLFFSDPRSESLGWQLLYEANTGLRTEEVLRLRRDAKPGEPGHVAPDGKLHVIRSKNGVNPFVRIHQDLKALMKAHAAWLAIRYPESPWFIPGRDPMQPADSGALAHALRRLRKQIGEKITSHGMRAFYVLVRRSQGTAENIIAWELGQRSRSR